MSDWTHGYVADVTYTPGFYRECMPTWLSFASTLLAQRPPDLSRPFRYADFGCGQGMSLLVAAATAPHGEFWGFDFNPAHIESARDIAAKAGLTNVHFEEASFAAIADAPASAYPDFDFAVSHGVLTWISHANAAALFEIYARKLRIGGLAYVSYNTPAGWHGVDDLRAIMRMLLARSGKRTDQAVPEILDYLERLKAEGATIFQSCPGLENRMTTWRNQDPRYLAHEFLNEDWNLYRFADVAKAMGDAKCTFVGSASMLDRIAVSSSVRATSAKRSCAAATARNHPVPVGSDTATFSRADKHAA